MTAWNTRQDKGEIKMTKKTVEKHIFPSDWSKISMGEAIYHIEYLLEHYKEYKVESYGKDNENIEIDGIRFWQVSFNDIGDKWFYVNMQKSYSQFDGKIYPLIQQLMDVCKAEAERQKHEKEIKAKRRKIRNVFIAGGIIIVTFAGMVYMVRDIQKTVKEYRDKQTKIENAVKQYERTLPYYDEYKQTQSQIANYRDSLTHAVR